MAIAPRFEVVEEPEAQPSRVEIDETLLRLRILAQRAITEGFSLITVATVFVLAVMIIPYQPSIYQLSGLAGYALFVLAINIIVKRR